MRASEWQFLCAVHEQPRSCCAIDYCCHTLDWAANVVTNPKIFPSRFAFADQHDKNAATKNLINVFRRLHRIFAHAWFQHRGVFWSVEGQTGLYVFFKTVCDMYDLLPAENYKLPPEAEGLDTAGSIASAAAGSVDSTALTAAGSIESTPGLIPMAAITDRKGMGFTAGVLNHRPGSGGGLGTELLGGENSVGRTNTRRHIRSSPSTGSSVTTVLEQDEDSSSPFGLSRPLSILQHANRLSTPLSRGAAIPPPAPTPPTLQDQLAGVSESNALADEAAENKVTTETVETVEEKEDAEAAEELAVAETDAPSGSAKEGEAPTTEGAGKIEDALQVDSAPAAEAKPDAGEDITAAEEPVAEATDKGAETAEPISDASAPEAATEETSEEPTRKNEPEAAVKEENTAEETNEAAEPEVEAAAADDTKPEAAGDAAGEDASPIAADDRDEADKPSNTAKAEPAGED